MAFFSSTQTGSNDIVGVIDIGSSSVGVAAISVSRDPADKHKSKILYSTRVDIFLESTPDFKRYIASISTAVKTAVDTMQKSFMVHPARYICFLSSPFYVSQTKILSYSNPNFVFSRELLASLSYEEARTFLGHHESLRAGSDIADSFEIIENKIMQIKLNGYEVTEPFNKTADRASIAQYLSLTSKQLLSSLRQTIAGASHSSQIEFHSFSFSAYSAIRDLLNSEKNFIMVDVSGELTDVSVVADGILMENFSFPYGENFLIRGVSANLNTVPAEALSTLKLNLSGKMDEQAKAKLEPVASAEKGKWLDLFKQTLTAISEHYTLPETIFFLGDHEIDGYFADWIKTTDFKSFTFSDNTFNFHYLDDRYFALFTGATGQTAKDTFMVIESIFCDKIIKTS